MLHKNRLLIVSIALLGTLLPTLAFAVNAPAPGGASDWTIWAFANTDVLYNILVSAKGLVSSGSFRAFLEFLAVIGVIGVAVIVAMGGKSPKALVGTFVAVTLFLTVFINTTANVAIQDTVTGNVRHVTDAPFIVVVPEAIISMAGHRLTQLFEQFYSMPDDLTLTGGGGFNLAASMIQASTQVEITDPGLRSTMAAFARNCIVPSLVSGRISTNLMMVSTQLWGSGGTLSHVNPAPLTPVYTDNDPQGVILPCGPMAGYTPPVAATNATPGVTGNNAYDYISAFIQAGAPKWLAQGTGAWAGTSAYGWLSSTMASAQSYAFGSSLTQPTGETIRQAAAINAMGPMLQNAAIASGQSKMVTALAVAQAKKSQVSTWATAVDLFRDLSGYIYSVLQAFLIAMTPILIAAAFIPGAGWKMVRSYMTVTVWLALWMPTLSIINFIVTLYAQGELSGSLSHAGGYNMASLMMVDKMTSHLVLAAGFLATMTPLITWALVKGSFAFTEFLAHGLGAQMAGLGGSIAATGNISLENTGVDNKSMKQWMMASTIAMGTHAGKDYMTGSATQFEADVGGGNVARTAAGLASRTNSATSSASVSHARTVARNASTTASTQSRKSDALATRAEKSLTDALSSNTSGGHQLSEGQVSSLKNTALQGINTALKEHIGNRAKLEDSRSRIVSGKVGAAGLVRTISGLAGAFGGAGGGTFGLDGGAMVKSTTQNGIGTDSGTDLSATHQRNTNKSGDYGRQARDMNQSSEMLSRLQAATRGVSSNATQDLSRAASLAHQSSVNYSSAETATEAVTTSSGITGNVGFSTIGGAVGTVEGAAESANENAPTNFRDTRTAAGTFGKGVDHDVSAKGNPVTTEARNAARQANAGAGTAQARVNQGKEDLGSFDGKRQAMAGALKNYRQIANDGAGITSGDARARVGSKTGTNANVAGSVRGQAGIIHDAAAKGDASTTGKHLTHASGYTGDQLVDAAAAGGATALGAVASFGLGKVGAKWLGRGAAAAGGEAAVAAGGEAAAATATGFTAVEVAVAAGVVGAGTLALGTGLALGAGFSQVAHHFDPDVPTVGDALEAFKIEHSVGVQLRGNPASPDSDDLVRRYGEGDE